MLKVLCDCHFNGLTTGDITNMIVVYV